MRCWPLAISAVVLLGSAGPLLSDALEREKHSEAERHYRAGEERMQAESFEEAAAEFKTAVDLDPSYVLAHYSLGQAYMALKRYPEAIASYAECRDVLQHENSLDERARAALQRQREDEITELRRSIQRVQSGQLKGGVDPQQETIKLEERIRLLENANQSGRDQRPEVPAEISLALGSAQIRAGHLAEAEAAYLEATKADSKLGAAWNNLAVVYLQTGRPDEADKALNRAKKAGFAVNPRLEQDIASHRQNQRKP
jgi:tetratricopeptide (TPR) repeat protein